MKIYPITAVVLTKNEEENIDLCLASLSFASEIIVIDDYSTDDTIKIAKRHGAIVCRRKLDNDFASQRNFALEKAHNEYIGSRKKEEDFDDLEILPS